MRKSKRKIEITNIEVPEVPIPARIIEQRRKDRARAKKALTTTPQKSTRSN
jgi:hypothetical protein